MAERGFAVGGGAVHVEYLRTASDTGDELHEMRATYQPRSPWPPAHYHSAQEERFVVQQGRLLFRLDGAVHAVASGQELVIPRGVVHQARNDAEIAAVALWQTRPAGRTGEFLHAVHAAETSGNLLDMALVVAEFADVFCLAVPPRRLATAAVHGLAGVARLLNRKVPYE